jgi:putative phage-type endonuclease
MTRIIRPKDRSEWLQHRTKGIGSSEVATIVGLNPYETPYQLWRRKVGIDAPIDDNQYMRAGRLLEDAVSRFFEEETNKKIIASSKGDWLIQSKAKPYLQVSPDRLYWVGDKRNNANKGILECKTTQKQIEKDNLPKHWFCQLQYQLGVSGLQQGAIAWLTQGRDFGYSELNFVPDFYEWLVEEVDRFWIDNILGKKEPDLISVDDVVTMFPNHIEGKTINVEEEMFDKVIKLKEIKNSISELETQKKSLEDDIKFAFADNETMSYQDITIATWKSSKSTETFDSKTFIKENPDLAKKYMKTSIGARRLLLK